MAIASTQSIILSQQTAREAETPLRRMAGRHWLFTVVIGLSWRRLRHTRRTRAGNTPRRVIRREFYNTRSIRHTTLRAIRLMNVVGAMSRLVTTARRRGDVGCRMSHGCGGHYYSASFVITEEMIREWYEERIIARHQHSYGLRNTPLPPSSSPARSTYRFNVIGHHSIIVNVGITPHTPRHGCATTVTHLPRRSIYVTRHLSPLLSHTATTTPLTCYDVTHHYRATSLPF